MRASLESVKSQSDALACRARYDQSVASELADRIREIIEARGLKSERALSELAGMNPTQVSNTLKRLEDNPDAVELKTLRKIADAAGVRWDWLLVGTGPRDLDAVVEYDDRYSNRAATIELYRAEAHPKAIEALRGYAFHGEDPSRKQWTEWLWAEDAKARREEPETPKKPRRPK